MEHLRSWWAIALAGAVFGLVYPCLHCLPLPLSRSLKTLLEADSRPADAVKERLSQTQEGSSDGVRYGQAKSGADDRIRTGDLLFTKQLLYH